MRSDCLAFRNHLQTCSVLVWELTVSDTYKKRAYEAPTLKKYGSVKDLTRGNGGTLCDGGGTLDQVPGPPPQC